VLERLLKLGGKSFTDFSTNHPSSDGYDPEKVSPYMHLMVKHVPTMMGIYGNIKQFSCQGVLSSNKVLSILVNYSS